MRNKEYTINGKKCTVLFNEMHICQCTEELMDWLFSTCVDDVMKQAREKAIDDVIKKVKEMRLSEVSSNGINIVDALESMKGNDNDDRTSN